MELTPWEAEPFKKMPLILKMELLPLDTADRYKILLYSCNFGVEFIGNVIEDENFMVDSILFIKTWEPSKLRTLRAQSFEEIEELIEGFFLFT